MAGQRSIRGVRGEEKLRNLIPIVREKNNLPTMKIDSKSSFSIEQRVDFVIELKIIQNQEFSGRRGDTVNARRVDDNVCILILPTPKVKIINSEVEILY